MFSSENESIPLQKIKEIVFSEKLQKYSEGLGLAGALKNAYDRDFGEKYFIVESNCEEGLCLPWESLLIKPPNRHQGTIQNFGWQIVRSLLADVEIEEVQPYGIDFLYSKEHAQELPSIQKELEAAKLHVGSACDLNVLISEGVTKRDILPICLHIAGHGDSHSAAKLEIGRLREIYPKGCIPLVILSTCESASPYDPRNISYALVRQGLAESVVAYPYAIRDDFASSITNSLYPLLLAPLKKRNEQKLETLNIVRCLHIAANSVGARRVGDISESHAITYIHRAIL